MKNQKQILKLKAFTFRLASFAFLIISCSLFAFRSPANAVSATPTPASPSATPTTTEDEKVKEIRDAIKDKVDEIKEKIEKRAYVGVISQITDSTITIDNFRGKQRVRVTENSTIIGSNKKEIKIKDLALEDKVIAMGTVGDNEILEAKRVLVVIPQKTTPAKRIVTYGRITAIDTKNSLITVSPVKEGENSVNIKIDKDSYLVSQADAKLTYKFANLKETQIIIVVYPAPAEGKTPLAKTVFLLL